MSAATLPAYSVAAYNTAKSSENKIHDDTVARRFGFRGGLVPGVDVYAYMTHLPVERWGRAWLERGTAECRFMKPVYEGSTAVVTAEPSDGGIVLQVTSQGELCATGTAALPAAASAPPALDSFADVAPRDERPPADEVSLAVGTAFGMRPLAVTQEFAAEYLGNVRETDTRYAADGLAHPGLILRICNWALSHNVVLGPWIHVGSALQNFAAAHVGDTLSARACVSANYERKGHRFVELDVLVLANAKSPLARVTHTAIYRPRQVTEG
jgi:acyl dehydratase